MQFCIKYKWKDQWKTNTRLHLIQCNRITINNLRTHAKLTLVVLGWKNIDKYPSVQFFVDNLLDLVFNIADSIFVETTPAVVQLLVTKTKHMISWE